MAAQQITLYNPETDITVVVNVSVEDAIRAENDLQFATTLMNNALEERRNGSNYDSANMQGNVSPPSQSQPSAQQEDAAYSVSTEDTGLYRWTSEMVLLLLDTYTKQQDKFDSGKYSQKKIWEFIAEEMREKMPTITGPQCNAKMRSLKKTYKSVKDHNNKSGNDRRSWLFYESMDTIFGSKAWSSPVAVASSSGLSQRSQESESKAASESTSRPRKENVVSLLRKRLCQKSEEEEARAKRHRERMEMDERMLALFAKLVDKN